MKKNKKPSQSTNLSIDPATVVVDEFFDMCSFKMKPATLFTIERIAYELINWALADAKAYKLSTFFRQKGLSGTTVKAWCQRSDKFAQAHEFAKQVIGDRREIGALEKKLDPGMVRYTMAHYDSDWKGLAEWWAKLRQPEEQQNRTQIVVIEKFPETK